MKARGDFIAGRFHKVKRRDGALVSVDPGDTDTIVGEFPFRHAAVDDAVEAATTAYSDWTQTPFEERRNAIARIKAQIFNHREPLTQLISTETGRPLWETRQEVRRTASGLERLSNANDLWPSPALSTHIRLHRAGLGPVAVLTPFPQAALLTWSDIACAVIAGCTVVCKPSPLHPATTQLFAEIVRRADLPSGVINIIQGDHDSGQRLVAHPGIRGILFGGRRSTRDAIRQSLSSQTAAPPLRSLTAGVPTAIVLPDADLDQAAYGLTIGTAVTSGQRCSNTRRVLVHDRVIKPLRERLVKLFSRVKVDHYSENKTLTGPMATSQDQDNYLQRLAQLDDAAVPLVAGRRAKDVARRGYYVTPALYEVDRQHAIPPSASLGPVLLASSFSKHAELFAWVQNNECGLVNAVFGRTVKLEELPFSDGGLLINAPTTDWMGDLPFRPAPRSGDHFTGGMFTAQFCSRILTTSHERSTFDVSNLPPGLEAADD